MTETEPARAKVNLRLRVLDRRSDGFHEIETLFCELELADRVRVDVEPAGSTEVALEVLGPDLGPPESNLAWRAATAFLAAARTPARVRVRLEKRIPLGAGLGGGSSDGAATLRALDRLLPGRVTPTRLGGIAAELGSDMPFFLLPEPLAWGVARGERLTPLAGLEPRSVLLAIPAFPVSTADAYRWLDEQRANSAAQGREGQDADPASARAGPDAVMLRARGAEVRTWDDVIKLAMNDFEPVVYRKHPLLGRVRDTLARHGARPALLAGSGSTVFGVFDRARDIQPACHAVARLEAGLRTVVTRTWNEVPREIGVDG